MPSTEELHFISNNSLLTTVGLLLISTPIPALAAPQGQPSYLYWAALLFISLAIIHLCAVTFGALSRYRNELLHQRLALTYLKRRIDAFDHAWNDDHSAQAWHGLRKFVVRKKVDEGGAISSFYLVSHDQKPLPGYEPGQYLTFRLKIPSLDKPVVRCYSLSDAPGKDSYRVTIKKIPPPPNEEGLPPGLSSTYFHDQVKEGDLLDVMAPNGQFCLDLHKNTPIVLIGGGIGITPLLSMLNAVAESGGTRETWLFYAVRNGKEYILRDHLRQVEQDHENIHVRGIYSSPQESDQQGRDYHYKGHVGVDMLKAVLPSNNYDFFVCGPPPMMNAITEQLDAWGVPDEKVHYEAFGPASVRKAKPASVIIQSRQQGVEVTFAKSSKSVVWKSGLGSILDLAERNGIAMDYGCRAGNCGTCVIAVRSGKVDYIAKPGAPAEAGLCYTCIAVPDGPVILDA